MATMQTINSSDFFEPDSRNKINSNFGLIGPVTTWTTFTPTWTASVSNPSIGNGVLTGRYFQIQKLLVAHYYITFGTTTNAGSGDWRFDFPVAQNTSFQLWNGNFMVYDTSSGNWTKGLAEPFTNTTFYFPYGDGSANFVGSGSPMTWASGDVFRVTIVYEAA